MSSRLSNQLDVSGADQQQMLKVYLRVRPFSKEEVCDNEDQGCVVIENSRMVALHAPKGSATTSNSGKGIGLPVNKFSFSQIFGPDTTQAELFEGTVKSHVSEYLDGKTTLLFSYGVTNAGKTYTIHGTPKEPGILLQVLDTIFQHIGGRQYACMDLKPHLGNDVRCLSPDQVKQERTIKAAIFASFKEECESLRFSSPSESAPSHLPTVESVSQAEPSGVQFALWVAFFEIYNECVYDLLQATSCSKLKKRSALRVCEDSDGNTYVRGLKWINIQSLEEASKLLRFGNKNRSAASTKLNQSSSRSHSIFTMKLLKIDGTTVQRISEFSLCDLAGSERCNRTKTFGERLKEAGNINNSLLILGKCITALRNNKTDRTKNSYIPFRESKLTKLFQTVLCGKGSTAMIVNINQCASTYNENVHVMKFSAIAQQVVPVIPTESLAPRLVGRDGKPLVRNGVIDSQALESYLSEEELLDEEDETNMSIMAQEELLNVIENLRAKLLVERRKNLVQEIEIRKEMGDAMLQELMESEELRSRQIAELKESYEEKLENTFEMYKDAIKEHAYQCAMNSIEDNYVPLDEFIVEQEKVEVLRSKLSEMENIISSNRTSPLPVPMLDQSIQTQITIHPGMTDQLCEHIYKEKCEMEEICQKQLIVSLEEKLLKLSEKLKKVKDDYLQKSADMEVLLRKNNEQVKSIDDLQRENAAKDKAIALLREELEIAKLSEMSPVQPKAKRGLLANIRESVTSPGKSVISRTLRKTVKEKPLPKKNLKS
ncbi:kinesin-like protein KIF20A [Lampris incognitus]|uniref:kinesin-like protein KIF20A n=1 Tax=Lampris incognitus TaxID=2546036 RepID=UPI0024B4D2B5|nr:kinesin-like protein KIF20A [Lampris incognitus]